MHTGGEQRRGDGSRKPASTCKSDSHRLDHHGKQPRGETNKREKSCLLKTNKGALTAGNKINGYNSRAALAKDMLVILLGKNLEI